jgi:hypothetical protein
MPARSWKRIALGLILWIAVMAIFMYLSEGAPKLHVSSASAMGERVENQGDVVFDYETKDLRVFAVTSGEGKDPEIFALTKRLGFWVYDYPSKGNIQGITCLGDDAYIYLLHEANRTLRLVAEDGTRIDPVESRPLSANGAESTMKKAISILRIGDYAHRPGNYRLLIVDGTGGPVNARTDEYDLDSIAFSLCGQDDGDGEVLEYTPEELARFDDDRSRAIDLFEDAVSRRTPTEAVVFEGSRMPDTQKDIYAQTTLGTYYKVEGKNRVFRWEHDISYHLVMNGEYKDTLLRHETNYMKHSLFEDGLSSISSSYKVEHTEALDDLNRVFHLFFPSTP